MYDKNYPTFLYTVRANYIGESFIEHSTSGKYNTYVSKNFYGAVIRSKKSLFALDGLGVIMSVRLKGKSNSRNRKELQTVTGIKIDLMERIDPRIKRYGIDIDDLVWVDMQVNPNIPGNITLNTQPALLSAYFYKRKDGSSIINFIKQ